MSKMNSSREGGGVGSQRISAMSCFEFTTKYKNLALDKSVRQCSHCDSYEADYPTWSIKKKNLHVTKILPRDPIFVSGFKLWMRHGFHLLNRSYLKILPYLRNRYLGKRYLKKLILKHQNNITSLHSTHPLKLTLLIIVVLSKNKKGCIQDMHVCKLWSWLHGASLARTTLFKANR